jgi:hypothetical protein
MANTPPTTPFLRLVSSDGDQVWQDTIPAKASIDCAHAEPNGRFWVTGTQSLPDDPAGTKHQREYVMRIGRDGSFSSPIPIDKPDRLHFPNCGIETESGFVLAGTTSHDKYLVPWIGMIDRSGHLAWENEFPQDQDQLLTMSGWGARCAGLRQVADGRLVWSAEIGIAQSAEEIGGLGSHWGVLTVVLDRRGTVLHRVRDTDVRSPLLALSHDRIIVYSTLALALPPRPKTQADAIRQLMTLKPPKLGLQRVIYNMELAELDRRLVIDDGNLIPQHSTPNGGLLAIGWDDSTKKTTLQYIAPDAQMSSALTVDVLAAPGAAAGRADLVFSDAAPGKVQMFTLNEQDGGRVYALGYKDNAINLGALRTQTPQSADSGPSAKPATPSSSEMTSALPIDNVRLKQLDELITYLGVLSQQKSASELSVALSMQMVAPGDPTWNPSHPRWTVVHDLVSRDLALDLGAANAAAERATKPLWERHLSRELPTSELQYLLDFYRSPRGIRYRDFQRALDEARISAATEYLTRPLAQRQRTSKASPELQALGERANALSLTAILARNEAAPPAGAHSTASVAQDPSLSDRFASDFRQLEVQYKDELDAFRAFNESPAIASVRKAALSVTNELPDVPEYQRQFMLSLGEPLKRSAEWQAAYAGQANPTKSTGQ